MRSFTIDELRIVLDVADPEWKSMILFGLYTGQRLADVATLRWSNVDLAILSVRLWTMWSLCVLLELGAQQRLNGAALVHRAVAFGHLVEGQGQVEDLAGIDFPVPHQLDHFGQEAAHRGGTAE